MKITILVEGKTEKAFLPHLRAYLERRNLPVRPRIVPYVFDGRIPTGDKLKRTVDKLLQTGVAPADYVVALTDVYTGTTPAEFPDAQQAKQKMREWVGEESRFFAHVALHDFEAWLLPYWSTIRRIAGTNRKAPSGDPETINHGKPPSYHIKEAFRSGGGRRSYVKVRDANRILRDNGLESSIERCPELRALIDTIVDVCNK